MLSSGFLNHVPNWVGILSAVITHRHVKLNEKQKGCCNQQITRHFHRYTLEIFERNQYLEYDFLLFLLINTNKGLRTTKYNIIVQMLVFVSLNITFTISINHYHFNGEILGFKNVILKA